jgi:predicted TIM-barrel fold metal-dependent hydrolase
VAVVVVRRACVEDGSTLRGHRARPGTGSRDVGLPQIAQRKPRWVTGADLRRTTDAVHELCRRVHEGVVALRVVPWLWELPPTDRRCYPLYAACVHLCVPFCTHTGHAGPLRPSGSRAVQAIPRSVP